MDAPPAQQQRPAFGMQLCVRGLGVTRGGRRILSNLDFALKPGQAVLLRGPNGSGKTTLLRALAGFLPTDGGSIEMADSAGGRIDDEDRRANTIYCGHADAVKRAMSVYENMAFWARLYGAEKKSVTLALERFNLKQLADLPASFLSAGQKRRLGLSRLAFCNKAIWLLDEPTSSLDRASVESFARVVEEHRARGGGALIATHDGFTLDGARTLTLAARTRVK
ncbi:MAG: heme ABC exporter ATP-binding protein CcmA [Parvularculaceae bacterium]